MHFWKTPPASGSAGPSGGAVAIAAAALAMLAGSGVANAAPLIQVTIANNSKIVSSITSNTSSGSVANAFSSLSFMASPADGSGDPAYISMAGVGRASSVPKTITFSMTETGITAPSGTISSFNSFLTGHLFSLTGRPVSATGHVTFDAYFDPGNNAFGLGSGTPVGHYDGSINDSGGNPEYLYQFASSGQDVGTEFSITEIATFVLPANTMLTFSGSVTDPIAVPEPWPIAVLGTTLAGLGLARRRRSA
jgi:hypothetical protein